MVSSFQLDGGRYATGVLLPVKRIRVVLLDDGLTIEAWIFPEARKISETFDSSARRRIWVAGFKAAMELACPTMNFMVIGK